MWRYRDGDLEVGCRDIETAISRKGVEISRWRYRACQGKVWRYRNGDIEVGCGDIEMAISR